MPSLSTAPHQTAPLTGLAARAAASSAPVLEAGSGLFVWSIWGALLALCLIFVARFGADVPHWDDYTVLPQLIGSRPVTLQWLWSQDSEHRLPLVRLILLGVFRLSGADPRPVMFLIVGLLAILAAVLLIAARQARGSSCYADAFLPVALLNLGHHETFLWACCVSFVLPVVLLGFVLACVVRSGRVPSLANLATAALCATLMPLCNGGGLAFIPAMTVWFWYLSLAALRSRTREGFVRGLAILAFSLPALLLSLLYFQGYAAPKQYGARGSAWVAARTTAQSLGMALGCPGKTLWPWSAIGVVVLLVGAVVVLAWAWRREPATRARALGLACVLGAVLSMAAGLGWARSTQGELAGLQWRYTTLAVPALMAAYFAFVCHGPGITRQLMPMLMYTGSCVLLWPNTQEGWAIGAQTGAQSAAFDRDLASGTPLFRLVRRYTPFLHPSQEFLHESLPDLRRAGIGRFRSLQGDPLFQERPVPLSPSEVLLARWNDGRVEVTGPDPWIRFDLPAPAPVCGIRIRYSHANPEGTPARFRIAWRGPGQREFPAEQQYGNWTLPTGPERTTTVWVDDLVAQIRVQPDNRPCEFTITELTLLVSPQLELKRP